MLILIVEDKGLLALAAVLTLGVVGYRTLGPAKTSEEALRLAAANRPDLAFVDINIPGEMDGIGVARELAERHDTSCIFVTANGDRARQAQNVALGVIDKPYNPRLLLDAVKAIAAIRDGISLPPAVRHLELFHHAAPAGNQ